MAFGAIAGAALGKIASTAGSFLAKHGGQILGAASNVLGGMNFGSSSSGIGIGASKELMDYQYELQNRQTQWLNENSYSQLRTGLERAGYNPLLAMNASPQSSALGVASAPVASSAQYSLGDIAGNMLKDTERRLKDGSGLITRLDNFLKSIDGALSNVAENFGHDDEYSMLKDAGKNIIKDSIRSISKATDDNPSSLTLKGYVSNSAKGEPFEVLEDIPDISESQYSYMKKKGRLFGRRKGR